jgi:hypothetical protein
MKAPLISLFAVATLGLVGYAIYTLTTAEPVRPRSRANADVHRPHDAARRGQPDPEAGTPLTRIARAIQDDASGPGGSPAGPPPGYDPNLEVEEVPDDVPEAALPITRAVAEATFDRLLTDLEEVEPENLADRDRDRLYRNVNDAFTALSARLGEDDVELMEDSYQRMQAQMKRLKIKPPTMDARPELVD